MVEDRSLDEFFDVSEDDGERDDEDADEPDAVPTDETPTDENTMADDETRTDDAADLPRATYRWSPDGHDCPVCGTSVNEQWRDGDRFVCADCKEW